MPSGDNTRVWFPEMLEELSKMWVPEMTWEEMNEICLHMGAKLSGLRKEKNINIRTSIRHSCGSTMELCSKISIRSLLFALAKINAISEEELKKLDKEWKCFQRKRKLNGYFEPKRS